MEISALWGRVGGGKKVVCKERCANDECDFCRRVLVAVDAETTTTDSVPTAERHIPDGIMPTGLCGVVLPKRSDLLLRENRRHASLQLFVSITHLVKPFRARSDGIFVCRRRVLAL